MGKERRGLGFGSFHPATSQGGGKGWSSQAARPGEAFKTCYAFFILSACGVFAGLPPPCYWVSETVRSTTAGSLASDLNIAFTGPGQIIGVWIYKAQDKPLLGLVMASMQGSWRSVQF